MILLRLFYEFAKVGLFAVGGGLATVPFLQSMGEKTGWFTNADLSTMIAVSESTPGPMGVNMATYVGYSTSGVLGAVVATLGLIFPCTNSASPRRWTPYSRACAPPPPPSSPLPDLAWR